MPNGVPDFTNFLVSSLPATLFRSVIPSDVHWSPPISGRGQPDGRQNGVPGQIYTDTETGYVYCKGTITQNTNWFRVNADNGHPTVLIGDYYKSDPNDVVQFEGSAVWYGYDKSIWVKTSLDDAFTWHLLLENSISVGLPNYYSAGQDSNPNSVGS